MTFINQNKLLEYWKAFQKAKKLIAEFSSNLWNFAKLSF